MISIALFIFYMSNYEQNIGKKYISPKFDGEKITPGHFLNEDK